MLESKDSQCVRALVESFSGSQRSSAKKSAAKNLVKVCSLLHTCEGRFIFVTTLDSIPLPTPLEENSLMQLAALLNALLTAMQTQNDCNAEVFFRVVAMAQVVYMQQAKSLPRYLNSLIGSHAIFKDMKRWEDCIVWTIESKVSSELRSLMRTNEPIKAKFLAKYTPEDYNDENVQRAAAFMIMSRFIYYMLHMNVPIVLASDVIMKASKKTRLDSDKLAILQLFAELQGNKPISRMRKSSKWRRYIKKVSCKKKIWGSSFPVLQVLPYLDWSEQSKLLSLNKKCYRMLTPIIMKGRLCQFELAQDGSRKIIWLILLKPHMPCLDYHALKATLATRPLVRDIEAVISADLPRSYPHSQEVDTDKLGNMLRAYAIYNPRVGYCQGLNYVAGTLYWIMQDEELAFRCLAAMFGYLELESLYEDRLSKLKESYYVLDRLVGMNLPDLHYAFQARMVSSSHFATSWILTMFGNLLHYNSDKAEVLFAIWDDILLRGWKPIFKACLAILQRLAPLLITMAFEEMMLVLTTAVKPDCIVDVFDEELMAEYNKVTVNNELINELRGEYEKLSRRLNLN